MYERNGVGIMDIVFVTNIYNHHQSSFARNMDELTDHHFYFIETEEISEERKRMGWGRQEKPSYVIQSFGEKHDWCMEIINSADVVIWGGDVYDMISTRLKEHKLTFCYSERLFKDHNFVKNIGRYIKYNVHLKPYMRNHYLLCSSAFASADYAKLGLFKGKALKWGYFPELRTYDSCDEIIDNKKKNSITWVGRMIDWKHPEVVVHLAKRLKEEHVAFTINLIGDGDMKPALEDFIKKENLISEVKLLGNMTPDEVRNIMEESQIFLMTSDQNEGWGAVLNEAMNSCCVCIANAKAGATPFLIKNMENGMIYTDEDELFGYVKNILNNNHLGHLFSKKAYLTISDTWNANVATMRLMEVIKQYFASGFVDMNLYIDGPLSVAEVISDDWYK